MAGMRIADNPVFDHPRFDALRQDYERIEGFLEDLDSTGAGSVRAGLRRLGGTLSIRMDRSAVTPTEALWFELQEMERRHHFSCNLAILTTTLADDADFMEILRLGRPIKDVGSGARHGEFTHRIQWYLLMQEQDLNKRRGGSWLRHEIRVLYAWIGTTVPERAGGTGAPPRNLWEDLFDNDTDDARSPEWLNPHMCNLEADSANYGVLGTACRNRYSFREKNDFIGPHFGHRLERTIALGDREIVADRNTRARPTRWRRWQSLGQRR